MLNYEACLGNVAEVLLEALVQLPKQNDGVLFSGEVTKRMRAACQFDDRHIDRTRQEAISAIYNRSIHAFSLYKNSINLKPYERQKGVCYSMVNPAYGTYGLGEHLVFLFQTVDKDTKKNKAVFLKFSIRIEDNICHKAFVQEIKQGYDDDEALYAFNFENDLERIMRLLALYVPQSGTETPEEDSNANIEPIDPSTNDSEETPEKTTFSELKSQIQSLIDSTQIDGFRLQFVNNESDEKERIDFIKLDSTGVNGIWESGSVLPLYSHQNNLILDDCLSEMLARVSTVYAKQTKIKLLTFCYELGTLITKHLSNRDSNPKPEDGKIETIIKD